MSAVAIVGPTAPHLDRQCHESRAGHETRDRAPGGRTLESEVGMSMRDEQATKRLMDAVRDLAPTIARRGDDIERARRVPQDLLAQLKEAGLIRS